LAFLPNNQDTDTDLLVWPPPPLPLPPQGRAAMCTEHAAGTRCVFDGGECKRMVKAPATLCVLHGGEAPRCAYEGCDSKARGGTGGAFCKLHGGGPRCQFIVRVSSAWNACPLFCLFVLSLGLTRAPRGPLSPFARLS